MMRQHRRVIFRRMIWQRQRMLHAQRGSTTLLLHLGEITQHLVENFQALGGISDDD
jgi:hypothetical protein